MMVILMAQYGFPIQTILHLNLYLARITVVLEATDYRQRMDWIMHVGDMMNVTKNAVLVVTM